MLIYSFVSYIQLLLHVSHFGSLLPIPPWLIFFILGCVGSITIMVLKAKATQKGMLREMLLSTHPQEPVPVPFFQLFFYPSFVNNLFLVSGLFLLYFVQMGKLFLIFPSVLHEGYLTTDTSPFAFFSFESQKSLNQLIKLVTFFSFWIDVRSSPLCGYALIFSTILLRISI